MTPTSAVHIGDDETSDSDVDEQQAPLIRVRFRILTPGFTDERVEISVSFPVTVEEVIQTVQRSRSRERAINFPRLIPACPQPQVGDGVLLACPIWSLATATSKRQICIDCSGVDGRVYTTLAPSYVQGADLPVLASLPSNLRYSVFVGPYGDLLEDAGYAHLADGDTVIFVPEDAAAPRVVPLQVALLGRQHWGRQPAIPTPSSHGVCCVVFGTDNILHVNNRGRPTAFRTQVAAAVGLQPRFMRILSSQPRVWTAAIDGMPCRSVVIVCEEVPFTAARTVWVLLDVRSLLLGWRSVPAPRGQISCRDVIDALLRELGNGWRLWLRQVPLDADILEVSDGQTFTVDVLFDQDDGPNNHVAATVTAPLRHPTHNSTSGHDADEPVAPAIGVTTAADASPPDQHAGEECRSPTHNDAVSSRDGTSGVVQHATAYAQVPFLLLSQHYAHEWVPVRIAVGSDVADALDAAAVARNPARAVRVPVLCAVHPQPCGDTALAVCCPEWEYTGAIVAIDSRAVNGRVFAEQIAGQSCRQDFLRLAGISAVNGVEVYFRDLPWPLPDDQPVRPISGDLVLIRPRVAALHYVTSLADMLLAEEGWGTCPPEHDNLSDVAWVLGPDGPFPLQVPVHRQHRVHHEIANSIGLQARGVSLTPAFGGISDFAFRGTLLRNVVVARVIENGDQSGQENHPVCICILDLRPILLGFDWVSCPEGIFSPYRVLLRLQNRCPPGYNIGRIVNGASFQRLQRPFVVQNGDVITLAFRWDPESHEAPTQVYAPGQDSPDSPRDHNADNRRSRDWHDPPSSSPARADDASVVTTSSAGDRWEDRWNSHSFAKGVKWTKGNIARCLHDGNLSCTPVILGVSFIISLHLLGSIIWSGSNGIGASAFLWPVVLNSRAINTVGHKRLLCTLCLLALLCHRVEAVYTQPRGDSVTGIPPGQSGHGSIASGLSRSCLADNIPRPRPVPTPCRGLTPNAHWEASRGVPFNDGCPPVPDPPLAESVTVDEDLLPLVTLLEESVSRAESPAFFLAATLLDTLVEHFSGDAVGENDSAYVGNLQLTEHLPGARTFDVTGVSMCVGKTLDDVIGLFQASWQLETVLPKGLPLHPATRESFSRHIKPNWQASPPLAFEIFPDGSLKDSASTWSFVVVAVWPLGYSFVGVARGQVALAQDDFWLGADKHSAPNGELTAIFWALAWVLQGRGVAPCRIWSDCLVAVQQASGACGAKGPSALPAACRALYIAVESAGKLAWHSLQHVPGHSGNPYNELADTLAKHADLRPTVIPASIGQLAQWAAQGDLQWLWLYISATRNPHLWPTLEYGSFVDRNSQDAHRTHGLGSEVFFGPKRAGVETESRPPLQSITFSPVIVSANVQTLETTEDDAFTGRVPYIREQLQYTGACIIGLQECRTSQSATYSSETHLRYTSAKDDKGGHGVELWLSTQVPFAWQGEHPLHFAAGDVRLLHWDPRTIIARFVRGKLRFIIAVIHAPTAADQNRSRWWRDFRVSLWRHADKDPVLLLGDYNVRLSDSIPGRIGDVLEDGPGSPPDALLEILEAHDLWLPSTFSDCHWGDSFTWISPGNGAVSRIDYIAVPAWWHVGLQQSFVLHSVDFGQKGVDHFGVLLRTTFEVRGAPVSSTRAPKIDVQTLAEPKSRPLVAAICASAPAVPWSVDPHAHYQQIVDHLAGAFAQVFPGQKAKCRQSFFTVSTWELRQKRLWLRKKIHNLRGSAARYEIRTAFRCLQQQRNFIGELLRGFAECLRTAFRFRAFVADLRGLKPVIKRAILLDRRAYLKKVAEGAVTSPVRDTVRKLRPLLGPPRRLQRGKQALPAIRLEDGSVAPDQAAADARWLRHFSAIEDGGPCDPAELIQRCLHRQATADLDDLQLCPSEIVNRVQLESSMRASPCHRACGNDGVPGELLHCHAAQIAGPIYQVFLKAAFRVQEPLQWKGGVLRAIWKQRGDQLDCSSYRAILVSSYVGKSVHGALRVACSPHLDTASMPLQIGGRREQPVLTASQAVRAFQRGCIDRGQSVAILFLDLQEAFHRVVRPLIHGGPLDDAHVAGVVKAIGLSPEAIPRLHAYVRDTSLLAKSGAPDWTARFVQEVNTDAWFNFGDSAEIAVVRGGTRPGDNLADLLFSFLFAEVLGRLRDAFASEGISVVLPWDAG